MKMSAALAAAGNRKVKVYTPFSRFLDVKREVNEQILKHSDRPLETPRAALKICNCHSEVNSSVQFVMVRVCDQSLIISISYTIIGRAVSILC